MQGAEGGSSGGECDSGDQGYFASDQGPDAVHHFTGLSNGSDTGSPEQYMGRCSLFAEEEAFKEFKKRGISLDKVYTVDEDGLRQNRKVELVQNEFVILKADQSSRKTHLGRFDGQRIVPLKYKKSHPYGVTPRNVGQYFLQEALMEDPDEAPLVIVKGMAGTAKTFYAVAVGLEKVYNADKKEYRKILISRPNAQFDDDIGYLPGTEQEKISPLMRPIIDNLEPAD